MKSVQVLSALNVLILRIKDLEFLDIICALYVCISEVMSAVCCVLCVLCATEISMNTLLCVTIEIVCEL